MCGQILSNVLDFVELEKEYVYFRREFIDEMKLETEGEKLSYPKEIEAHTQDRL